MVSGSSIIQQIADSKSLPDSSELLKTLLELEKNAKKDKREHSLADLIGCWNLRFITGTKKSRKRAGIVLGAGRYIPRLLKIKIHYQTNPQSADNTGKVKNEVQLGWLNLSLTGPVQFITSKNILAFDFTYIDIMVRGFKLHSSYVKEGLKKEAKFYYTKLKHQAFFGYFLIQENVIAARGKGGGLALWTRD
jgi:hypothetical protein